jgi:GLTT repeat (6 copies)
MGSTKRSAGGFARALQAAGRSASRLRLASPARYSSARYSSARSAAARSGPGTSRRVPLGLASLGLASLGLVSLGLVSLGLVSLGLGAAANSAMAATRAAVPHPYTEAGTVYTAHVILSGTTLTHTFTPAGTTLPATEPLSDPDDITLLGDDIFVGFQDGVGPQGQPSADGNQDSTVVELKLNGDPVAQWDVLGKTDGVTADPQTGQVIATVNEDANSSLYTINPTAPGSSQVTHYSYNEPLPHNGGTDAISIYRGQILISASAPGTTGEAAPQPTYPAAYSLRLDPSTDVAQVTPLFYDEDSATVANVGASNSGQTTTLALTDPDSNEVVPTGARFGDEFMLTSQGDQEQIYVSDAGGHRQRLAVLSLSQSVDDTAWPTQARGTLYSTDSTNDSIVSVRGPFVPYQPLVVATPCGANSAPASCPAPPGYPANYLATLNPETGQVTAVTIEGATYTPQGGLLWVPRGERHSYPSP